MRDYRSIDKAELHAHLSGCVPSATIGRIARQAGVFDGPDDALDVRSAVDGLAGYFRRWDVLRRLRVTKEDVRVFVRAAAEMLAADGVVYAELRHSAVHIAVLVGVPVAEVVAWHLDAFDEASHTWSIDLRLLLSVTRHEFDDWMPGRLLEAIALHREHPRLVGVDLAGNERDAPFPAVGDFFLRAKADHGMGVTIHAGEAPAPGAIRWALEACDADRLGHALAAAQDATELALLAERDTCIEVCLTSNALTGYVPRIKDHPVQRFIGAGVPFVLCTDNPAMHGRWLSGEYAAFVDAFGDTDMIETQFARQMRYRFGSP